MTSAVTHSSPLGALPGFSPLPVFLSSPSEVEDEATSPILSGMVEIPLGRARPMDSEAVSPRVGPDVGT